MTRVPGFGQHASLPVRQIVACLSRHLGVSEWAACQVLAEAIMARPSVRPFHPTIGEFGTSPEHGVIRSTYRRAVVGGDGPLTKALHQAISTETWQGFDVTVWDDRAGEQIKVPAQEICIVRGELESALRSASVSFPVIWSVGQSAPTTAAIEQSSQSVEEPRQKRIDAIGLDIELAIKELGEDVSPGAVMALLRKWTGQPGTSIFEAAKDGVLWRRYDGESEKLTIKQLRKRLVRRELRSADE